MLASKCLEMTNLWGPCQKGVSERVEKGSRKLWEQERLVLYGTPALSIRTIFNYLILASLSSVKERKT